MTDDRFLNEQPDKPRPASASEDDEPGQLWRGLKSMLFGGTGESSLRAQLEEVIDGHEGEPQAHGPATSDLTPLELEMFRNLLHFSEHRVDDIMVPRADIVAIEETEPFARFVEIFSEHGHSRIPVYRGSLDSIVGMIHVKDIFAIVAKGDPEPASITPFLRQPRFVPESMGVLDLLAEMRSTRTHLAIIIDEYSGTEGLVTIEDLVEEIVGDIEDEHDEEPEPVLRKKAGGIWIADARAELDVVGANVDAALAETEDDVDTIGGLAFVLAGHIPEEGEMLDHASGWRLEIVEADDRRVRKVKLHPPKLGVVPSP